MSTNEAYIVIPKRRCSDTTFAPRRKRSCGKGDSWCFCLVEEEAEEEEKEEEVVVVVVEEEEEEEEEDEEKEEEEEEK